MRCGCGVVRQHSSIRRTATWHQSARFSWAFECGHSAHHRKGGHAVPAINGEGEALLSTLQHLPKRQFAQQLAQYCLDHPDFGANGCSVWFESNLSPQECEQGLAEYMTRFSQG